MSSQTMDKTRLLKVLQAKRRRFEALLFSLTEVEMIQPALAGDWSAKDLLAHIAAWDRRGTLWINTAAEGKVPASPKRGQPTTPRNGRALSDIVQDFHDAYQPLLGQIRALQETDIPRTFRNDGDVITMTDLIRRRYNHRQSHGRDLRAWKSKLTNL